MSRTLGELRWTTGGAVDPSAPWSPLGAQPLADAEDTWNYVVALIAATMRQRAPGAARCPERGDRHDRGIPAVDDAFAGGGDTGLILVN